MFDQRLRIFLTVARTGQLTEAARQLNMSISGLSAQIASLERDINYSLFNRTNHGMRITDVGQEFLKYATDMETQWHATQRNIERVASGRASVHLSASQTIAELFLPRILGQFRDIYPDIHMRLSMNNTHGVVKKVATGQVDFGLIEGIASSPDLLLTDLFEDQMGLIVSAHHHPWQDKTSISIEEVLNADLILREPGSGTRTIFELALQNAGLSLDSFRITAELSSFRVILAMVRYNVGVSILSKAVTLLNDAHDEHVHFVPIKGLELRRQIRLVTRKSDPLSPSSQNLLNIFTHNMSQFIAIYNP